MRDLTLGQKAARDKAFREGQQAYREGRSSENNPFPDEAVDYRAAWRDGFECEDEAIHG